MNRGLKILTVLLCGYLSITQLNAQVTGVKFQLKYDTVTCLYNVSLIIAGGSATSIGNRTMFNAQLSFVVPKTDSFEIVERFMPRQNNGAYNGTIPMEWLISNTVLAPAVQPQSNFYAVIPTLTPTSQYNNLFTNDTIKLFSVRSFRRDGSSVKSCADNIRFFINGVDPNSSAPGMGGGDFNNGFTIGSATQLYQSNIATAFPPKPALTFVNNCSNNIDINLTAKSSACQKPLTYNWSGPGYFSASEDVFIPSAAAFNNGIYNVTVTDNLGCTSTLSIASEIKPNAGMDQMKCGTGSLVLSAVNPTSGTWTAQPGNPPNSTLGATAGGNATANFNPGAAGTFKYIYSTAICKDTLSVVIASSLSPIISGVNSLCASATTALTANGGTSYSWSNGSNSPMINVGPGTYTVTATDANGCTGTSTKIITSLALPTASISGANSVCSGSTISINATGGNSYSWSTGSIAASINIGIGTYTVTVTNANGCTDTEQKVISAFAPPTASISGANNVCSGKTVAISASGGNAYVWNTGAITAAINAGPGTFTVTVTDANGCTDTEQKIISSLALPTGFISGATAICTGSNTSITASGGNSYTWSTGSVTPSINVSNGTFTVTVTDANGCTDTEQKIISTLAPPTAVISGANSVCNGNTVSITASGGNVYTWNNGDATASINIGPGTYTVTVTNANGCTDSEQKVISALSLPTATISGAIAVCSGATIPVTASGGVSYLWSNGANTPSINVSNGTFTVTVTDVNGCKDTEQKVISSISLPTALISGANAVCNGNTTSLTASGGVTYLWSNGANTPSINTSNGTFTVTVTDTNGCKDTDQKIISSFTTPTAAISGANSICVGASTPITASGGVSYSWNNGAISPSITVSNGTYTVTITDANGCTDTEQKIITTTPPPNAVISGANAVCIGRTTSITASGGVSYLWNNGAITPSINVANGNYTVTVTDAGGCTDTEQKIISTFAAPTAIISGAIAVCSGATTTITAAGGISYVWSSGANTPSINVANGTFTVTVTDLNGCKDTEQKIISSLAPPTALISGANAVCSGKTTSLTASGGVSYLWSNGSNTPSINVSNGTFTVTVTDVDGCKDTEQKIISSFAPPTAAISGANSICVGASTPITASGGVSYSWNNGAITPSITVSNGTFTVTVTDANGCTDTEQKIINTSPPPNAVISGANAVCIGGTTSITASGGISYAWSNGAITPSINVANGNYTVTVTDAGGCTDTEQKIISTFTTPTAIISGAIAVCSGATTTITAAGGISYVWSSGANTPSINVANGTFTVTVTDVNGCKDTEQKIISSLAPPTALISGANAVCSGKTTSLTASGGVSYLWSNGSNTPSINVSNGTFTVTVTDVDGCKDTEQKIISSFAPPTAAISGANSICVGASTPITASGGVSYSWNNGAITPSITVSNGTFTVTVTDASGCTDTEQKIITTTPPPNAVISGANAVCIGRTTSITASGGVSYAWSNGAITPSINVANGNYTVTVTDAGGCTDTEQKIISTFTTPTAIISGAIAVCSGATIPITATGGVSYLWSNGANTPSINVANGTFTVTVTDVNGCKDTEQKIISSLAPPTALISGANAVCSGNTTPLTASGGVSYLWSNGANTPSINVANGTFTVTVTDADGCKDTEQKIISSLTPPTAAISGANAVCIGGTTSITASGGVSYSWNNGAITPSITVSNGTFTVTVTDASGCTDTEQKIITTTPPPNAVISGANAVCIGRTTSITASGGVSYAWSNGAITPSINVANGNYSVTVTDAGGCTDTEQKIISTFTTPTAIISGAIAVCSGATIPITATGGVSYLWSNGANTPSINVANGTFTVTVTDVNGCKDTEQKIISSLAPPTALISGANAICNGKTISLTASGGFSYLWNNGANTPSINVSNGTYTVTVTDTDGCTASVQKIITSIVPPTAIISGANTICSGENTFITASGGVSYLWDNGAITSSINVSSGTFTVTVTDTNGCTDTEQKNISTISLPLASISGANEICNNTTTVITASGGISYLWNNGAVTPSISVSNGTYSVTVTNSGGCSDTEKKTISIFNNDPVTISGPKEICLGASANWTATGGQSYIWSNGATTASINLNNIGTYTVTVTNANGCIEIATQSLNITTKPVATINGKDAICTGESTNFNAVGGVSYLWSNGNTSAAITVNTVGTYSVTVTDASGCKSEGSKVLVINTKPVATISGTVSICHGSNTTWTATGGQSYIWNTGANTAAINLNNAGTYTVTVTNASGCSDIASQTLIITTNPIATINGKDSICSGESSTFTAVGGVSYLWNNGNTSAAINVNTPGTYSVTVTDAAGCKSEGSKVLVINSKPVTAISGANSICTGSNATWTATGGQSYIWSNGAITAAINLINAGTYTVTVTNASGCSDIASQTLTITTNPAAKINGKDSICTGESSTFTAVVGLSYLWSNGNTSAAINVNTSGTYSVTVTDAAGCKSEGSKVLVINSKPVAAISGANSICTGSNATWTATGGQSYIWSNGANTAAINLISAGTYTVTVTNASGCSDIASQTLTITTNPVATINGKDSICSGESSTFTAVGGVSYLWSNGNTSAAINVNIAGTYSVTVFDATGCIALGSKSLVISSKPIASISGTNSICNGSNATWTATGGQSYIWSTGANTAAINLKNAGTYTVTVTNVSGCSDIASQTLTITTNPVATINGKDSICAGESSTFIAVGGVSYLWSNGNTSAAINVNTSGTYSVTVTDAAGCKSEGSKVLVINSKPVAAISGANSICTGSNATWTATGGQSYIWSNGANTAAINLINTGTYTVTVTNVNGCSDIASKTLTITTNPVATINGKDTICIGESSTFTAVGGVSYLWSNGNTSAVINVNTAGTYSVTVTDVTGCKSLGSKTLVINSKPVAAISGANSICTGSNATWTAAGGQSYIWSTGANTAAINLISAGTYTVTVTNASGCSDIASKTLTITTNPIATINGKDAICSGESSTFTAVGGVSYLWSNGNTSAAISVNTAGTYSVTVTDAAGCKSEGSKVLVINSKPVTAISGANSICTGSNATWTATGGQSYIWSNGANTAAINLISAGTYTVTVTNASGCSDIASQTLTITTNPIATINGKDSICTGESSTFTAVGGVSYLWSNGNTSAVINVNTAGTYSVTVTDVTGCKSLGSKTLVINSKPVTAISGANSICTGSNATWTATGGQSYFWSNGANTAAINLISAGTYTVTVTNASGCSDIASQTLTITTNPVATINGKDSICTGESSNFTAVGGVSYLWSNGNTSAAISVNTAGTYSVTVTDAAGCKSEGSKVLVINSKPVAAISGANSICTGSNAIWTATSGQSYIWSTGANTAAINLISAGTYTVTVTNASGCSDIVSQTLTITTNPIATINGKDSICTGESSTFTAVGGVSYLWSNGNTSAVINVNTAGTYSVTVTDVTGCKSLGSKTLVINSKPVAAISGANSICTGSNATWTATGGQSYIWSNGANTAAINLISAGTYTVTVTNASGCSDIASKTLTITTNPIATINGKDSICTGESSTFTAVGGVSYLWSNGNTSAAIRVITAGTYSVTVIGASGCKSPANKQLNVLFIPDAGPNPLAVNCYRTGSTSMEAKGTGTWQFSHNNPGTAVIENTTNLNTVVKDFSTSGIYHIIWTNGFCSDTATITVNNNCNCPISANTIQLVNQKYCDTASSIVITGSDAIPTGGIYLWEYSLNGDPFVPASGLNNIKNYTTGILKAGNHRFRRIYSTISGIICSDFSNIVTIEVNEKPSAAILGVRNFCEGQSTQLSATGGILQLWNNGSSSSYININQAGAYSVTVTNNAGCTATANTQVTVNSKPSVTFDGKVKICIGTSTTIKAKGGNSYLWSNSATSDSITISSSGMYFVTVSNINGCINVDSIRIETTANPTAAFIGSTEICEGEQTTLTATGGVNYLWSNGNKTSSIIADKANTFFVTVTDINGCSSTANTQVNIKSKPNSSISGDSMICKGKSAVFTINGGNQFKWSSGQTSASIITNGISNYTVTVTGSNGCKTVLTKSLKVNELPNVVIAGNKSICKGTEILLTAEGGTSYLWNNNSTDKSIRINTQGVVTLKVTDANGCENTTSVNVNVYDVPQAKINGQDSICNNSKTVFIATGGTSYLWDNGSTSQTMEAFGNKWYSVTITDVNGCTATASKQITTVDKIGTPYDWLLSNNPICIGDTIYLQVKGIANATYNWSSSSPFAGLQFSGTTNSMMVPTKEGKYIIKVLQKLDECNLKSLPAELEVDVNPRPRLNLGQDTIVCQQDGGIMLVVDEYPHIKWSNGSSDNEMLVTEKGYYSVLVEDENGCISSDVIQVKEFCCKVNYPNIISVDSWNGNNQFKVSHSGCVITSKISIYDRWGNLVYRSNDGLSPWDGTFGGKPVELGVYTFIFTYTALDADDKEFEEKVTGNITVIR